MQKHTTLIRTFGIVGLSTFALALGWCIAPAAAADAPEWQPMLAKSFKSEAKDIGVTSLVVYRHTGCVFLQAEGKVYCSSHGANSFKPVTETWNQVCATAKKNSDSKHLFVLTDTCIKESTDGGATYLKSIPLPKKFVTTAQTWVEYDAVHDVLYLMKAGSDLYKLARGK